MNSYQFQFGGSTYTVSPRDRDILRDGVRLKVEPKEFELALYFCQNVGRLLTRQAILKDVWGEDYWDQDGKLDTYAYKLRAIYNDSKRTLIHAEKKRGLIFCAEVVEKSEIDSKTSPSIPSVLSKFNPDDEDGFPAIWNVPFERNGLLKGRDSLIQTLHSEFECTIGPQILLGMSGRGKTQIAVEYAYRYKAKYDLIWWIRARHSETLDADFSELAHDLGCDDVNPSDIGASIKAVRQVLRHKKYRSLIVLDNAIDSDLITKYLGQGSFRALITTPNVSFQKLGHCHEVGDLDLNDAVDFLITRTRQTDKVSAVEIAKELTRLPVALEHAAAYIGAVGISLASYLAKLQKHKKNFDEAPELSAVATTWETTILIIKYQSLSARLLIMVCSVLAPEKLPISTDFNYPFSKLIRLAGLMPTANTAKNADHT